MHNKSTGYNLENLERKRQKIIIVLRMFEEGYSYEKIRKKTGYKSKGTIHEILSANNILNKAE